eukprot:scaffold4867_cov161-Ochromonas_danica.AAC.6
MDDPVPFDNKLKYYVKTLAYDSDSCKSYIAILITTDYVRAMDAYEWNGGTKIAFLGQSKPWDYRWTKDEISMWLGQYKLMHQGDKEMCAMLEEETDSYKRFKDLHPMQELLAFWPMESINLKPPIFPYWKLIQIKSGRYGN